MTINEVDQALRNLIANQPMIATGPAGMTITSVLSIIDSYKNFKVSVQNYPVQDNFKFVSYNESQKFENFLSMSICQTLQEKGINLLAFIPNVQNVYNAIPQMPNQMPGMPPMQNPNMQMAHQNMQTPFMYNQPVDPRFAGPQRPMGGFQQPAFNGVIDKQISQFQQKPQFDMQPNMMQGAQQKPQFQSAQPQQRQSNNTSWAQPQRNSDRQPNAFQQAYTNVQQSSEPEFETKKSTKLNEIEIMSPMGNQVKTPNINYNKTTKNDKVQVQMNNQETPSAPEVNQTAEAPAPDSNKKAAGRDYLLQLLKK